MKRGFTVIELVVSIAIAGLLGSLLLAAVNSARESARATHCRSNLLQLSTAIHSFESRKRIFPSAGWTFFWLSLSDRGTGENQPGSWIFNILPDLEQTQLATGSPSSVDLAADRSELFGGFARKSIPNVRRPPRHQVELS
jgi:prepilin-type N-terminal cleavage/methylation domain-containing protein